MLLCIYFVRLLHSFQTITIIHPKNRLNFASQFRLLKDSQSTQSKPNYVNNLISAYKKISISKISKNAAHQTHKAHRGVFIVDNSSPVLIVPGFGGSRLLYNASNETMWPPSLFDYTFSFNNWRNNVINNKDVRTPAFGDKTGLKLNAFLPEKYNHIIKHKNTFPLPFDFRQIDNTMYLRILFENITCYIESFGTPITLLCHSTGGLIIHWFLANKTTEWKSKYIRKLIYVSVPFSGSELVLYISLVNSNNIFKLIGKDIFVELGATIFNLPPFAFDGGVFSAQWAYLLDTLNATTLYSRVVENRVVFESFKQSVGINNTEIIICNNLQNNTPIALYFDKNNKIKIKYGAGDGSVSISSLMTMPLIWHAKSKSNNYTYTTRIIYLKGMSHSDVLQHIRFTV